MKHKLKIVHENGTYVGYAFKDGQVVFQTNPCKDSASCSRALTQYAGKQTAKATPVPLQRSSRIVQTTSQNLPTPVQPPVSTPKPTKRCCGRG